jgi:hypothetical protein
MIENTPYSDLKEAIAKLEKEQAFKGQLLKDEFRTTYDNLNPFNLIKRSFTNFIGSPEVRNDLIGMIMPLITGFLVKKASGGSRRVQVVKEAGILFLDGLGRYIISNPDILRTVGQIITSVFHKKKTAEAPEE